MRRLMLSMAAVVAGGLGATAVHASPLSIGPFEGVRAPIAQVADGCGPGFHRNPWGRCRPNGGYGYGPPPYGPRGYGYDRGYDRPPPPPPGYRYGY